MTQTYYPASGAQIRDGTWERLKDIPGIANVYKAKVLPLQANFTDDNLPAICVWNLGEETSPMGDPNCGPPSFDHTLRLGVEITCKAEDEDSLDTEIVIFIEQVRIRLLSDPTWVELFEGIEHFSVDYVYPNDAGEYIVHARINITVTFRSIWPPFVPDEFEEVGITIPFKGKNLKYSIGLRTK